MSTELDRQLYDLMGDAVANNPRPDNMSLETCAAMVLAARLVGALKRAEQAQAAKLAEYAAKQALVEANTAFFLCDPYQGISVIVREGEERDFAKWYGIPFGDLKKVLAGEMPHDLRPNPVTPRIGKQLAKGYKPEPTWLKLGIDSRKPQDSQRVSKQIVAVDWHAMTHAEALRHAEQTRKGLPVAVVAAYER